MAILVWVVLNKTTFGYELKAVGLNKSAARYAGINEKQNIILSMVIAGALQALARGLFYLSSVGQWNPRTPPACPHGLQRHSVALLASSNPIGTIFSSLFISISGGRHLAVHQVFPQGDRRPDQRHHHLPVRILHAVPRQDPELLFKNADKTNVNAEPAPAEKKPKKEGK